MASNGAVDLKTKLDNIERLTKPVKAGETIPTGTWAVLDANDEFVAVTTKTANAMLAWSGTEQVSSRNTQGDPIFGDTTETPISTGGVTALHGKYRATVDNTGFDDTKVYTLGLGLTCENGKLTPDTGSDPVVAYVMQTVGADNKLQFRAA